MQTPEQPVPVVSHRWEDGWWLQKGSGPHGDIVFNGATRTEVVYASLCPEDDRWLLISACGRPWVARAPRGSEA